jgi:DNA-binding MarR family transcriptional regulator
MTRRDGVCHPVAEPSFTAKQGQYLAFMYAYTRVNGRAPAEADLQRYFGVTPPSVHQMVLTLERRGLIERTPGLGRSGRSSHVKSCQIWSKTCESRMPVRTG